MWVLQVAEYLFDKGLFDLIVPHNPLKGVLSEYKEEANPTNLNDFY